MKWLGPARAAKRLEQLEAEYVQKPDPWVGLHAVQIALDNGLPVPGPIAVWLSDAILRVRPDGDEGATTTLGALLGIEGGRGTSNPRRAWRTNREGEAAYFEMKVWHSHGATVEEAAEVLCAKGSTYQVEGLLKLWKRHRSRDAQPSVRGAALTSYSLDVLLGWLAEEPDTAENARAKQSVVKAFKSINARTG